MHHPQCRSQMMMLVWCPRRVNTDWHKPAQLVISMIKALLRSCTTPHADGRLLAAGVKVNDMVTGKQEAGVAARHGKMKRVGNGEEAQFLSRRLREVGGKNRGPGDRRVGFNRKWKNSLMKGFWIVKMIGLALNIHRIDINVSDTEQRDVKHLAAMFIWQYFQHCSNFKPTAWMWRAVSRALICLYFATYFVLFSVWFGSTGLLEC